MAFWLPSFHSSSPHDHLRHLEKVTDVSSAKALCHADPLKCPVNGSLISILDSKAFHQLNVTFIFPEIPMTRLDPCTKIQNRGERIRCVDEELRVYSMETQKQVVEQLNQMPHAWFEYYQNFSIMNRLIVKMVKHEDVIWRTALAPTVLQAYEEQHLPIESDSCIADGISTTTLSVATEAFEALAQSEQHVPDAPVPTDLPEALHTQAQADMEAQAQAHAAAVLPRQSSDPSRLENVGVYRTDPARTISL
jgi:hypothetical protein